MEGVCIYVCVCVCVCEYKYVRVCLCTCVLVYMCVCDVTLALLQVPAGDGLRGVVRGELLRRELRAGDPHHRPWWGRRRLPVPTASGVAAVGCTRALSQGNDTAQTWVNPVACPIFSDRSL